jgi:energy-converting hydrogenase Eha subunit G
MGKGAATVTYQIHREGQSPLEIDQILGLGGMSWGIWVTGYELGCKD